MRRTVTALLCAVALATGGVGCGSGSGGSDGSSASEGSGDSAAEDDGSVDDSTPEAEGEGTEEGSDGGGAEAVSVTLPGLPVGGNHSVESPTLQCADVGWTTPPDFPDGTEIKITGIGFGPEESFELSSESCPGDAPACLSDDFRLTGESRCSVAVAWTGEGPGTDDGGWLSLSSGEIFCEPGQVAACEAFKHELESITDLPTIELDPRPDDGDGTDESGTDEGTTDDGTTDDGTTDDGTTDDGTTDDGTTDDGTTDDGSTDDGSTDDGSTDDGSTDDGSTDDGSTDDGSGG
jgi:hypothetical protein